jgi:hypothetical protein
LNTGGEKLNAQELRNSLYSGPFNDLIIELASHNRFTEIWGIPSHEENIRDGQVSESLAKNTLYSKMGDCEIVLRFFAFIDDKNISGSVRGMLDRSMRENRFAPDQKIEAARDHFMQALELSHRVFGKDTFRLPADSGNRRLSRPLYDAVMCTMARLIEEGRGAIVAAKAQKIKSAVDKALGREEVYEIVVGRPNTADAIRSRIAAVGELVEDCIS